MDQAYYWTPEWQEAERESQREINAGHSITFQSVEDAIAWLDADATGNVCEVNPSATTCSFCTPERSK